MSVHTEQRPVEIVTCDTCASTITGPWVRVDRADPTTGLPIPDLDLCMPCTDSLMPNLFTKTSGKEQP